MKMLSLLIAIAVGLMPCVSGAVTFFSEDFESYTMDGDVSAVGGWTIFNTAAAIETEAQWHLLDTKNTAFAFGLPAEVNFGPATTSGATTPVWDPTGVAPGGLYIGSFSGGIPPNLMPTLPDGTMPADPDLDDPGPEGWNSRINNGSYTGASHDMITPSFSTAGATGDVWLHASISSQLDDNGTAIFDIDVSTDGGANWVNHFRRISPGTGRNFANGDFDQDVKVNGRDFLVQQRLANSSDCTTCGPTDHDIDTNRRNSDQRYSNWEKAYQGSYTPVVATIGASLGEGNAGGTHGELDLNLGAALGGEPDVKIRFRHYEQSDDEAIVIDNIRVDEVVPPGSESVTIYAEDFNSMTLGTMGVYSLSAHPFSFFLPGDSGGGSGTLSGFSWGAQDRDSAEFPTGRYNAGSIGRKGVNHLGHPDVEGPLGQVPFAIIDPKAEEDNVGDPDNIQAERLHTPILDLSGHTTVILEWDDEIIFDGNPILGSIQSVVLMEDDDGIAGPSEGDTIIAEPDKVNTDFTNPYLPYDIFAGGLFSDDDSVFAHRRIDFSPFVAMATDKTKLYIAWQVFEQDTDYWAIDNILITGDGVAPSAGQAVPEPAAVVLLLLGAATLTAARPARV